MTTYYEPPVPDDAVRYWDLVGGDETLVSSWYMPSPTIDRTRVTGWHRRLAWALIAVFLVIEAVGLCSAYGVITIG